MRRDHLAPRFVGYIGYRFDDELHARVRTCAHWKGQPIKEWVRRAMLAEVERQEADRAEDERRRRSR